MQEIALLSGNVLKFGIASIEDCIVLTNMVAKAFSLRGLKIKIDRDTELNVKDLFFKNKEACIQGLSDVIFDKDIMNQVMKCSEKSLYCVNGVSQKITLDVFEKEEYRKDFYDILIRVAIGSIKPFFRSLLTTSKQD